MWRIVALITHTYIAVSVGRVIFEFVNLLNALYVRAPFNTDIKC